MKKNHPGKQKITVMTDLNCHRSGIVIWRVTVVLFTLGLVVGTSLASDVEQERDDNFIDIHNPKTLPARLAAERIDLGIGCKPCIARLPSGELLVVASSQKRAEGDNTREDKMLYRSGDGGKTWSEPEILVLPGSEPYLSVVNDGTIFITSNLPAQELRNKNGVADSTLHRSQDAGRTWSSMQIVPEESRPVAGITTRNVLEMVDGSLMIGVSEHDINNGKSFMWVSTDKGKTWAEKVPAHFDDIPRDYPYAVLGEAYMWQAGYKIYAILTMRSGNSWPIAGTTDPGGSDNTERMILYSSRDKGRNWQKVRDLGDYGQMYPSTLRLDDDRILLTFTQRAIRPSLGVRAVFGRETCVAGRWREVDFTFDMENDHIMLDAKTGSRKSGGGFGPTVKLENGTLVTSYSCLGEDNRKHVEVARWQLSRRAIEDETRKVDPLSPSAINSLLCYAVKPISSTMRLPDTLPINGKISDTIGIVACRGEYEPASFVLHALKDVDSLRVKARELKSRGNSIPASALDIKVVKCWYQSGTAWVGHKQNKLRRVLVPELLLNDETLVKVDRDKKENYLKLRFPQGDKYVWISNPEYNPDWEKNPLPVEEYPLRDSPELQPVNIAKGINQQFWVTVKVPDDAKPGRYTGKIDLSTLEGSLGSITVKLRVLPFTLSKPKTNNDLSRDFICSLYTYSRLGPNNKGCINSIDKTEQQYRAEMENLLAHGVTSPIIPYPILLARSLEIRREVGITDKPLFIDNPPAFRFREYVESFDDSERTQVQAAVTNMLKTAARFGLTDVYIYGWDERNDKELLAMKPVYKAMQDAGAKTFVAGFPGQFEAIGDALDLSNMGPYIGLDKKEPEKWHSIGHKLTRYATPHAGVENPEVYRRSYGLMLWKADYDGAMDFCYWHPSGYVWNDFDDRNVRGFCYVYPTANGVIDTIAWEGFREAMDDIRYATTLRLAIEKGKNSQKSQLQDKARSAEKWLGQLDIHKTDLDTIRLKMIEHILELSGTREKSNKK
jgi:hypothetical protein